MEDIITKDNDAETVGSLLLVELHRKLPEDILVFAATTDTASVFHSLMLKVQKSVIRDHMNLDWLPCAAHLLNLAIGDACLNSLEQCSAHLM